MSKIFVEYEQNVPILRFSECKHCKMPYGKRHPNLPNRGCCWYDAEFDLFDAKNIIDKNMDRWTDIITHYRFSERESPLRCDSTPFRDGMIVRSNTEYHF